MGAVFQRRTVESFLTVFCPTFCCLGVGMLAYGNRVFTPQSGLFQLGANAVIVGVFVLTARRWSARRFLGMGGLIAVAMTAMTVRAGPRIMFHTAVLMVMWVGVVFLNVRVLSRYRWVQAVGQYVVWSLVFAVGLFGAGAALMVFFRPAEMMSYLMFYGGLATLTGIGLGIGLKAQDWLSARLRRGPM
jgi:hypothetical protein